MTATRRVFRVTAVVFGATALFLTAASRTSSADPVTVQFTLIPDPEDPVNLVPSHGTFTYDTSLVPPNGGEVLDVGGRLASQIAFDWGSTSWTEANAGIIFMRFTSSGNLRHFRMGGAPNGLDTVVLMGDREDDFWLATPVMSYTLRRQPEERWYIGQLTSPDIAVPEPGTLLLVGSGVLMFARRRARSNARLSGAPSRQATRQTHSS